MLRRPYIAFAIALAAPARAESVQVTISNLHAIKIVIAGIVAPGVIA